MLVMHQDSPMPPHSAGVFYVQVDQSSVSDQRGSLKAAVKRFKK